MSPSSPQSDYSQRLNDHLDRLKRAIKTIASCEEFPKLHQLILEESAVLADATGGSLFSFEGNGLTLKHSLDPGHVPQTISFPLAEASPSKAVLEKKQPLLVNGKTGKRHSSGWSGYNDGSFMVIPLMDNRQNILYLVNLHNKRQPPFTEEDRDVVRAFLDTCGGLLPLLEEHHYVRHQREYFLDLLNHLPSGFVLVEPDGKIIDTNFGFAGLLKRTPEDCLTLNLIELSPEPERAHEEALLKAVLRDQYTGVYTKHIHFEDQVFQVRALYRPFDKLGKELILGSITPL